MTRNHAPRKCRREMTRVARRAVSDTRRRGENDRRDVRERGAVVSFPAPRRRRLYHHTHASSARTRRLRLAGATRGSGRASSVLGADARRQSVDCANGENRQRKVPLARPRKTRAKIHRDESRSAPLGHRWNRPVTNLRFASTLGNRQLADAYAPRVTNACGKPPGRHLAPRTARDRLEPSSRDTHMFALRRVATRAFAARAGAQRVALRAFANQCPHDPSKPYHKSPLPLEAAGGLLEYSVVYTDRAMNHMSKPFCKVRARPPNAPSAVPRPARPRPRPRERWKNIPSRCLSTRPPSRTNHGSRVAGESARAAVPDRARGEHRPARYSRRALHGGSARVRPPPVAHARPARAFPRIPR